MLNKIKKYLLPLMMITVFTSCSGNEVQVSNTTVDNQTNTAKATDNEVMIYSCMAEDSLEYFNKRLAEDFPDYDITVEYMSTGNLAAKLLAEGNETDCDIIQELEYGYLSKLDSAGYLADVSSYDTGIYVAELTNPNYFPAVRNGGAIVINKNMLEENQLPIPTSYEDLLNPEYKGLISMPNPKASGTGYMFLLSLVNAMGQDEAFNYFDKLNPNILQYTSSGSGPVNALIIGEVAIGLGMTAHAVSEIGNGNEFEILFFEEGSPYSMCGQAIVAGKENDPVVAEVFERIVNIHTKERNNLYFPEQILIDGAGNQEGYPTDIKYADMSNDTIERKEELLALWKY